jgi:hypothetical protein
MTTKQALQLLTTLRPKTSYSLSHIDTCSSDYFSGHHLPVVQVLVDENSTYKDIKDGLLSYWATDHIEDLDTEAYELAVNELFESFTTLDYVPDTLAYVGGSMEDDDMWDLYMYFVIETLGEDDE